jgi:DNA-binding HxlR family transcriptional regulator
MLGRAYERENCSAARALEIVGERWSLLILRNALYAGSRRFNQFQKSLGIATNILSTRLDWLIENGLMESRPAVDDPDVREYVLTAKGLDFEPVILALSAWGDQWAAPDGPPIIYNHAQCGGHVRQYLECETCHENPKPGDIVATPGPGMPSTS